MPHRDPAKDRRVSAEVLAACGKPGMVTRLTFVRLRLLAPVVQHGPQALHSLFDYVPCRAWQWVAKPRLWGASTWCISIGVMDSDGSLGSGVAALPAWVALARSDPGMWRRGLARVERRATATHVDECLRVVRRRAPGFPYKQLLDKKLRGWISVTKHNFLTRGVKLQKHISKKNKFEMST